MDFAARSKATGEPPRTHAAPAGFLMIRSGRVAVWVRRAYSYLFDPGGNWRKDRFFCGGPAAPASGRGQLLRVSLGVNGKPCGLVRHYRRGGFVRHLLGDLYLGSGRFFQEVRVTEWARSQGVATAEVLALRVERTRWGLFEADLMTREIENARDLLACLRPGPGRPPAVAEFGRTPVIRSVAALLRGMHEAGLDHPDLNLKNILLQRGADGPCGYVIDLDRASVKRPLARRRRVRSLARLYRSAEKLGCLGGEIRLGDCLRFIKYYSGEDRGLEQELRRLMRKGTVSLRLHRLFWRLTALLGEGRRPGKA